jgi:hypothetical protein
MKHKKLTEMGAFKDPKVLETEINKELVAFQGLSVESQK